MVQKAIILASGLPLHIGSRSSRRTRAMLPIVGKPFAARVMERLRQVGIGSFVALLGPHDGVLATYLNESWYPDAHLEFVMHTGTDASANALLSARNYITEPCLVTTVEQLVGMQDYQSLVDAATAAQRNYFLQYDGQTLPVGVLGEDVLQTIADQTTTHGPAVSLAAVADRMLSAQAAITFVPAHSFQTLNSARDLLAINQHYLDDGVGSYILTELDATITISPPVRVDPGVRVGAGAEIGPYVYLETGAKVGAGAVVRNSVVLKRGIVPENQQCENLVVAKG